MKKYKFTAEVQKHPDMNAAYVEFPYDVEKEFGTRGRVKVQVQFDGHNYRGSLAPMGKKFHLLGLTQMVRKAIGKEPGDKVQVILHKDEEERTVEVPADLQELLKDHPVARTFFDTLSYTHRKEYVQWITGAKKEETRKRRLQKTVEMLSSKTKHP